MDPEFKFPLPENYSFEDAKRSRDYLYHTYLPKVLSLCKAIQIMYDRRHTAKNYPKKDAETLKRFRDKHFLRHSKKKICALVKRLHLFLSWGKPEKLGILGNGENPKNLEF